jgi:hypothetical protein
MSTTPIQVSTDLGPSITTFPSGKRFFLHSPTFDIEDIAHALGMMCRYGGHVRHFYSVAEHSVIVSLLMKELKLGDPMEGLLHDAHEAYLVDLPKPWKTEVGGWAALEHRLETEMRTNFSLTPEISEGAKTADLLALFIEGHYLKLDRGEGLFAPGHDAMRLRASAMQLVDAGWRTMNLLPQEATAAFLKQWNHLRG